MSNLYDLHKRIMKYDSKAIDEIDSLEDAKKIIAMIVSNLHSHKTVIDYLNKNINNKITINEYNNKYLPEIDRAELASSYEHINNTLYKCDDHDGAMNQLETCLKLSEKTEKTIHKALELYKKSLYDRFDD